MLVWKQLGLEATLMAKSHLNGNNTNRQTHSIGNANVWTSPANEPKVDKREQSSGHGQQGMLRCPTCGTLQTAFKASYSLFARETMEVMGIKAGDLLVSRHTPEGKRFRARAGDVRCQGSEMPVLP